MISTLQLARLLRISQGTVDRALHGRPGVSAKTRERVLATAAKHGYRPHPAAREILTGRSPIVQAILPSANNVFFMDLCHQLGTALSERNLRLQIAVVENAETLLATLEESAARRHCLAVVIPPPNEIRLPALLTGTLPVACLFNPCLGKGITFITPDEQLTAVRGVDYLVDKGHREIAFISSPLRAHAIEAREEGYRKRMKALKLKPRLLSNPEPVTLLQQLDDGVTALFCINDWSALSTLFTLQKNGVQVPKEVSILGIDDSPTLISLYPDLTTLHYPIEEAVEAILALAERKKTHPSQLSPFYIVERSSVAQL